MPMTRRRARARLLAPACAVLVAGVLASACAASPAGSSPSFARPLAQWSELGTYADIPESVTAAMPSVDPPADRTSAVAVVAGTLTGWEPGEATRWDTDAGTAVAWDDDAETRVAHLSLAVAEVIDAPGQDLGEEVVVELVLPGDMDADAAADEIVALDDVVLFLDPTTDSGRWRIVYSGAFLGDVRDHETVGWPVLEVSTGPTLGDSVRVDARSLDDLRRAVRVAQGGHTSRSTGTPRSASADRNE